MSPFLTSRASSMDDEEETESEMSRVSSMVSLSTLEKMKSAAPEKKKKKKTDKTKEKDREKGRDEGKDKEKDKDRKRVPSSSSLKRSGTADFESSQGAGRVKELESQLAQLRGMYSLTLAHNDGLQKGLQALRTQLEEFGTDQDFDGEDDDVMIILQQKTLLVHHLGEENHRLTDDFTKLQAATDRTLKENQERVQAAQVDVLRLAARVQALEAQLQEEQATTRRVNKDWEDWGEATQREFQRVVQENQQLKEDLGTRPAPDPAAENTSEDAEHGKLVEELRAQLQQKDRAHLEGLQKLGEELAKEREEAVGLREALRQKTLDAAQAERAPEFGGDASFTLREEEVASAVQAIKTAAELRVQVLEKDHQRKLREMEDRLQTQARGELASLARAHEEDTRALRERVAELEEQAGQQLQSLDSTLTELFEAKGVLEQRLQEAEAAIEAKTQEIAQYDLATAKLRSRCDSLDQRLAEEKAKSQRLGATVEQLEGEKAESQGQVEQHLGEIRVLMATKPQLERELRTQQQLVRDLQAKLEAVTSSGHETANGSRELQLQEDAEELDAIREELELREQELERGEQELQIRRWEQDERERRLRDQEKRPHLATTTTSATTTTTTTGTSLRLPGDARRPDPPPATSLGKSRALPPANRPARAQPRVTGRKGPEGHHPPPAKGHQPSPIEQEKRAYELLQSLLKSK